ncbi:MAG: hypothetical protein WCD76_15930 [Pyrinomonadaceae bacterium]
MGDAELRELLETARPLYDEARRLYEELQTLQTVEQAHAEFKNLLGGEERRLAGLRQQLDALESEKQSLARRLEDTGGEDEWEDDAGVTVAGRGAHGGAEHTPAAAANPIRVMQARRRFQMLVNRFGYFLGVSDAARAQINQITEDPQRPLGEALVLLDWDAFAGRIGPSNMESDDKYRERLMEWGEALKEYISKAEGDVRAVHVRYGQFVMRLWEAWRAADAGDPARWEQLIEGTRHAYAHQATKYEEHIVALEVEVAGLRDEMGGGVADGR